MKTHLKILAALVSLAVLGLCTSYVLSLRDEPDYCSALTLYGEITSEMFIEARTLIEAKECLGRPAAAKKILVVTNSGGGNGPAALAIGILLRRHNWDVEITDLCASSCAIFIFPAGKTKYLNSQSMLLFHGGPHQENLLERTAAFEHDLAVNGAPAHSVVLGNKDKEGVVEFKPNRSPADDEVLEFLSLNNVSTYVERAVRFRDASDQFYRELGVNPLLGTYGQTGSYEHLYKSYKYGGFIYRLDSLRRLGIGNIELKDGEWHPERHPVYQEIYEVTYP